MEKKPIVLNKDILMPAGLVVLIIGALASAIYWVSNLSSNVEYVREAFRDMQATYDARLRYVEDKQNTQDRVQAQTDEKLRSIDENVKTLKDTDIKELRDDVKKLLTAPQYRASQ